MDHKYFLIISNGRTGSSWLETSLGVLSDVAIDFEFKWQPTSYKPGPIHKVISDASFSSRVTLDQISNDVPVVGSKLVFDPLVHLGPDIIKTLGLVIEKDISIVHLSRNYFDTLLSWGTRKIYNALSDQDDNRLKDTMILSALQGLSANHDSTIRPMCVVRGELDMEILARENQLPQSIVPFDNVVNMLLTFFYNDLICRELAKNAHQSVFLRYDEIEARLGEVAKLVGSAAGAAEIDTVRNNPVTRRLGGLGPELVRHADAVQRVTHCLDKAMDDIVTTDKSLADIWIWSADRNSAVINVPGLKSAVVEGQTVTPPSLSDITGTFEWPCKAI